VSIPVRLRALRGRALAASLAVLVAAMALVSAAPQAASAAPASATAAPICGTQTTPPQYLHVIWIWMENEPYNALIGAKDAPFLNRLAGECGLATNYHNLTHPSAPEYLGATSGYLGGLNDCTAYQCPDSHYNLFAQVTKAGENWMSFEQGMQQNCYDPANASDPSLNTVGLYDSLHNPAIYYTDLTAQCMTNDVPMAGNWSHALADNLPSFSFITPNKCEDDHDCPVSVGDEFLSDLVGQITQSGYYRSGNTVIFITWDEGEGGQTNNCATNTTDIGCHVPTVVVSRSSVLFNHYSLLKTTEDLLGLRYLGNAADPSVASMTAAFNL
jgi:hypothetical protein